MLKKKHTPSYFSCLLNKSISGCNLISIIWEHLLAYLLKKIDRNHLPTANTHTYSLYLLSFLCQTDRHTWHVSPSLRIFIKYLSETNIKPGLTVLYCCIVWSDWSHYSRPTAISVSTFCLGWDGKVWAALVSIIITSLY